MGDHDDLLRRLRDLGAQPVDPARQVADLAAMALVRPRRSVRAKLRLAAGCLAGLMIGGTGLAAADVLPDPAQHVAHEVLDRVGVGVPDPSRYHGPECGAEVKKNHGAYVRDDHSLAQTDCGKKVTAPGNDDKANNGTDKANNGTDKSNNGTDKSNNGNKPDKDPCQGAPPWADDKTMTAEEKAAAQAEWAAQCGSGGTGPGASQNGAPGGGSGKPSTPAPTSTTTPGASHGRSPGTTAVARPHPTKAAAR